MLSQRIRPFSQANYEEYDFLGDDVTDVVIGILQSKVREFFPGMFIDIHLITNSDLDICATGDSCY